MSSIQNTADKIKDILTLCLAKGIDTALSDSLGYNWFEYFRQDDSSKKKEHMILRPEMHSIYDFDFQALLKLMKFHMDLRIYILSYFHPGETNIDVKYGKNSLFDNLLYRLMTLYRNQIAAHKKAADVKNNIEGTQGNTTYSYDDAIADMKKLAENFNTVLDEQGVSYYSTICNIANNYYNQASYQYYSIDEAIAVEQLSIDRNEFMQICDEYGIKVISSNSGFVFATHNYNETLAIIKSQSSILEMSKSQQQNKKKALVAALIGMCLLSALVLFLVIFFILRGNNNEKAGDDNTTESILTEASSDNSGGTDTTSSTTESKTDFVLSESSEQEITTSAGSTPEDNNVYYNPNNYAPVDGTVTVKPATIYYDDQGNIIASCYIINGTNEKVGSYNLGSVDIFADGKQVCHASFEQHSVTLNLEPGEHSNLMDFQFPYDTVKIPDANLTNADFIYNP